MRPQYHIKKAHRAKVERELYPQTAPSPNLTSRYPLFHSYSYFKIHSLLVKNRAGNGFYSFSWNTYLGYDMRELCEHRGACRLTNARSRESHCTSLLISVLYSQSLSSSFTLSFVILISSLFFFLKVNLLANTARVTYRKSELTPTQIAHRITAIGYEAQEIVRSASGQAILTITGTFSHLLFFCFYFFF